jgi:hypothetical protein
MNKNVLTIGMVVGAIAMFSSPVNAQSIIDNPPLVSQSERNSSRQTNLKQIFVGTWEAQLPENKFQMKVTYNSGTNRYEGVLTKQGQGSQNSGFSIGELVWTATLSTNSNGATVLLEQAKWRWGKNGVSTSFQWRQGNIDLGNSNANKIVTSTAVFYRVN